MKTIQLKAPIKGINNVEKETNIPKGFLSSAVNVDIDREGNVSSRSGYTKIYSAEDVHSIYKGYFVEGNTLKFIDGNNNVSDVIGLNAANRYISYCEINNVLCLTDGVQILRLHDTLDARFLAPKNPMFQPEASITAGNLPAGTYQYAICNVDTDGVISGTGKANTIELSHGYGIEFTKLGTTEYAVALFISNPNGTELYLRGTVNIGITSASYVSADESNTELNTQFMDSLPAGQIIRYFKGKTYVADNNILRFSQPHRYGLHKPSEDFYQFPSRITIVEPVNDGIYVVADKTYFLRGTDNESVILDDFISVDTGIEGTGLQISGVDFGVDSESDIAFWVSNKGLVLGLPGGKIKNLTEKNIAVDTNLIKGTSMYREVNGKKQILTSLNGGGDTSTFTSTDTLTSTIIRNGVEIT